MRFPRRRPTAAEDPSVVVVPSGPGPVHWMLVGLGMVLAGWLYVTLAGRLVESTNQNPLAQDQKNNMRLALKARAMLDFDVSGGIGPAMRQWLPHLTDGVVAPLWPWVAARVARDGHVIEEATFAQHTPADVALFERGKWLNVWISGVFLAAVGVWAARRWTVLGTLNCVGLGLLGAVLPRAVTFQPEPLYYAFFFLAWVMGGHLCRRNSLGMYALFGLVCGLAGLAKGSIQPLMAVWFGATLVRGVISWWRPSESWSAARHGVGVVMWAAVFLLVSAPRLAEGQARWGRPFFSYPGVWMWMDDFQDGYDWMNRHPDARSLDLVPADQWPSFANYRAHHTPEAMGSRLRDGLVGEQGSLRTFLIPKGSGKNAGTEEKPWKRLLEPRGAYLAGLALVALAGVGLAAADGRKQRSEPPHARSETGRLAVAPAAAWWPGPATVALFWIGTAVGLTVLYGWYTPIGRGDRFMLSLWMPLVFSLTAMGEAAVRPLGWGVRRWAYTGLQAALLCALLWRVAELLRAPYFEAKLL